MYKPDRAERTSSRLVDFERKRLRRLERWRVSGVQIRPSPATSPGKAEIEGRIKQIRAQIDETTSDYDREKLQERLGFMSEALACMRCAPAMGTYAGNGSSWAST